MTLCPNCGVELDDGLIACPLCGKSQENNSDKDNSSSGNSSEIKQLNKTETRKIFWELTGIIAFSGIAVCTIVDLITNKSLNWSLYSGVSVLAGWIIMTLIVFASNRPLMMVSGLIMTILLALLMIDLLSSGHNWFLPAALPITVAVFIAAVIIGIIYKYVNLKGLNVIASGFIILSGLLIIIEMVLDNYLKTSVDLRWSLIAAVSIFPAALLLFFYHYRLRKGNRLDSYFHV